MNMTLRIRVLLYLLLVSLSGILIASMTIFSGVENQFTDYVTTNRAKSIETIKKEVIQLYDDTGELTNEQTSGKYSTPAGNVRELILQTF